MKSDVNLKTFEACSSNDEKLNFLKSLNLSTTVKEKNGVYYCFIPALSLSTQGENVEDCYNQLQSMKVDHFKRLIETDTAEDVLFSNPHFFLKGEWARIKLQTIRYFITGSFVVLVVLFLGWQIDAVSKRTIASVSQRIRNEITKIKSETKSLSDVPEEKKKERLERFKSKLQEIKPYTDALSEVLFDRKAIVPAKKE